MTVRRPVDLLERLIVAQVGPDDAALEEEVELGQRRIGRGAAVARDGEGAAGVRVFERGRPVGVLEPALEQAREEAVAGAEHVEDLDRKAGAGLAVVEAVGDGTLEGDRALRAALADQRRVRDRPHRAQRRDGVGRPAGDVELLLGADDQVEEMQRGLQLLRHRRAFDEAAFALTMAGNAPEVRAIVDVERGPCPVLARKLQRLQHRRLGPGMAEMRAGRQHRARLGNEALVDVLLGEPHVGAVLAVEDQRKPLVVADAEDDERGQPLGVGFHAARVHALAGKLLKDEAAHVLVAHPGDHRAPEAEARRAAGDVRRRAPDVLRERAHVLEPAADLISVEIDRRAAYGDQVQRFHPVNSHSQKPVWRRKSRLAERSARMLPVLRGSRSCSMVMYPP